MNLTAMQQMQKRKRFFSTIRGQGLVEVIVAVAIFSLITVSVSVMVIGSFTASTRGGEYTEAVALAKEAIEALRSIKDGAWNELIYEQAEVAEGGGQWLVVDDIGGDGQEVGRYTRFIQLNDVCRDALIEIVSCPGYYTDVHTLLATVIVSWESRMSVTNSVEKTAYITNWDSREWVEDMSSDFIDGTFTATEHSTTLGDGDGAVTLQEL